MHQYEKIVLKTLLETGKASASQLAARTRISEDAVLRACQWLEEKKAVEIEEKTSEEFFLSEEAKKTLKQKLPEQRLIEKTSQASGTIETSALAPEEKTIGISWAKKNEWIEFKQGKITLTEKGRKALKEQYAQLAVLEKIAEGKKTDEREIIAQLEKRTLVARKQAKTATVKLTREGEKLAKATTIEEEANVLTREMLAEGKWRNVKLREYNVEAPVERAFPGKPHPIQILMGKIKETFLEMGFEEMQGSEVESSFWNFDALFQPQDHPARELADTFYLKTPQKKELPDKQLVERVKQAHEKGWKYEWNPAEAQKQVLRTHTTAVSARYLHETRKGERKDPAKYFSIGRVYRNEATDYKHLAEFHQVEGIVVWEDASFRNLLGCLKQFYSKLGFEKIRFRPSYFPYTEPSLEIEAFFESKNAWLELGGAGIFRPEVSIPLWGKYPVLAWGLSLERPLMLATNLTDIRTIYRNDLKWLRESKIGDKRWQK